MEEIPLQPNKPASEAELSAPDPEKIGDLLLRYELPKSEPVRPTPIATEHSPKLIISRDRLRARLERYKELKFTRPREITPATKPEEQLTEAHFERRHEIRDESAPKESETEQAQETTPGQPPQISPVPPKAKLPPTTPPPLMPAAPIFKEPATKLTIPPTYKKPLVLGLLAGAITGATMIFIFLK